MERKIVTIDGNEAAAYVAHKVSEVIAIYPITPSSPMGELADAWSSVGKTNIWGQVPKVVEMQSEGGAAGAVHGSLQAGAMTTTFTASQGLLLMIPNMYKIAGELTPFAMHVAARSLAAQGLSIFCDHSDVMAVRAAGFAMLASASVQEAMDMALISHAATLETRLPFLHFFDGFRTSHEVMKIEALADEDIRALIDDDLVRAHRDRGLSPDHPVLRGTAQNPDVYFQGRETVNPFYEKTPEVVQRLLDELGARVGRHYKLYEYSGALDAERVVILMGSGAEAALETVEALAAAGEKVGVLRVRLYRPFASKLLLAAIPESAKRLAVLDRTKEPGATGEPLLLDVLAALDEGERSLEVYGGRYGLGSKEFTPAMIKGVFDEMVKDRPRKRFTVGIDDDVSRLSIDYDPSFSTEKDTVKRAVFYGLGADGTVGANKNSIKIIGEGTDNYAQGYFEYDSKKSGAMTISHLRFGSEPIRSTYLIERANFVACHQAVFLERSDVLEKAEEGAVFLLNTTVEKDEIWNSLPRIAQERIINRKLEFYAIDAYKVANAAGMGGRINTVMQTCFFAISGILPRDEAIAAIKEAIKKTYGKRGEEVVKRNYAAVDQSLENMHRIEVPEAPTSEVELEKVVPDDAPEFVREVTSVMMERRGDSLPVSLLPIDGTFPTDTARWERRNIALEIPVWDPDVCIQCNKCALVCPHAVIRAKVYDSEHLDGAPEEFKATKMRGRGFPDGAQYTLQVAPEDCTGCALCVEVCPAKNKQATKRKAINMEVQAPLRASERKSWDFFLGLPEYDRRELKIGQVKESQFLQPLFEFSGACSGCGETPYVKLVSQLYGDRSVVANATGCSSIYGGNLPTTPWAKNADGHGTAWANSLFEDNAEFGLGMRLAMDSHAAQANALLAELKAEVGGELAEGILGADQDDEAGIYEQRERVEELKSVLAKIDSASAGRLAAVADYLVKKDVWIMGGDGWAYDIGFGGLDHVMASGADVNIMVMDTEVYSNTGGQMSKATPRGAVAKFAAGGKRGRKKDLAQIAIGYGNVYVANIAMGASDSQTVRAIVEAEAYKGPSIIIAYSHCIAHGINMRLGLDQQKAAVDSGYWPLFRYHPENGFSLDSKDAKIPFKEYALKEARYSMLARSRPGESEQLLKEAQEDVDVRWAYYKEMAEAGKKTPPQAAG
ncbi:MAG: pyruvate-ferredoxin/flavodoxin oxidoreductase [Candidatus Latescibacterota bacterium]|jgi:pyruvate-ferredoxin/flavodoxin oxidoreductase